MPAQQRGTGFIGLDRYLDANRNAAQGMVDRLTAGIGEKGTAAQQGLDTAQREFDEKVQAGTLVYDPKGLTAAQAEERAGKSYTGPDNLGGISGFDTARTQAEAAARDARLVADQYGRQALLADTFGKQGGYNPGMQRMDSFLTGAAGGGRFEELKGKYGSLSEKFGTDNTAAQQKAQEASTATGKAREQYAALVPTLNQQDEKERQEEAERRRAAREEEARRRNQERASRGNFEDLDTGNVP